MRRSWWVWAAPMLVLACGCGAENYNKRLDRTIAQMKRDRRLAKNLEEAPRGEKRFTEMGVYIRPPKGETLNKVGVLAAPEGQYELNETFADKGADAALHLLARVKLPKKPPAKGQAPPVVTPRGELGRDVLDVLTTQFGPVEAFATPKWAPEQKGENRYQRLIATANNKEVVIYTYKKDNTEAALIFVYDPKLKGSLKDKIEDCLATFTTGERARRLYADPNADPDEEAAPAPSSAL